MSYILDALRKADAERDRGNVPGIHAQPSFGGAMPASSQPAAKPWLWVGVGALAVLVVGGLAWYLLTPASRGAVDTASTAPTGIATTPVAPAPLAAPVAATSPPAAIARPVVRKPKPAVPAASAATEANPTATAEKVYTVNELPDDVRRQLPNLVVGGSMYSKKPADRILILNGQVAHEGDKVGNDLVLQQIRLKAALLNFRGYRYTISF
jgi:general secretion pathway protein B